MFRHIFDTCIQKVHFLGARFGIINNHVYA